MSDTELHPEDAGEDQGHQHLRGNAAHEERLKQGEPAREQPGGGGQRWRRGLDGLRAARLTVVHAETLSG